MTNALNRQKLIAFIKETLGCGCPDAVFRRIHSDPVRVGRPPVAATRIAVGDTLLIYLVHPASIRELTDTIAEVADSGRRDRDSNNYNRFRLVVSDNSDACEQAIAAEGFSGAAGADEKMHIHFVGSDALLGLYEP